MKKILLVEDDIEISQMLSTILASDYVIIPAFSGTEALLQYSSQPFDLVILDIMLPGKTGKEVLQELRETSDVPILMLTALKDKKLVAEYLESGADDYLTKPFDLDELKARINVQFRRKKKERPENIHNYKNIVLDSNLFQVSFETNSIQLARKEFLILELLINHPNKVYTKEDLYEKVWKEAYFGDENTVNVHISNIRKKLHTLDPNNTYIETVWSIGVKLAP